jgi:hypothetical protein
MKHGLTYQAAVRVARRARRDQPRLRLPVTYSQRTAHERDETFVPAYDKEREKIVVSILTSIERRQVRGLTDDNVTRIVAEWAGPLAKFVVVGGVSRPRPAANRGREAAPTTLRLAVTNSVVLMELRPRLKQLQSALKPTGITEVKL